MIRLLLGAALPSVFARSLFLSLALALALPATPVLAGDRFIIVQSTTSTKNSGLLDYLLPRFTEVSGIEVRVVAVGTGQALKNARNGDADVLLVHARGAEEEFVAEGYGVARLNLMYNDFVIVGPRTDPAAIAGMTDATPALMRIAAATAPFVSRGDDSGTHKKELALWHQAAVDAGARSASWYRESGSGMGATLNISAAMGAYTITDRATWIAFGNKGDLTIVVQGDQALLNQYGVILVSPVKHAHVKARDGQTFIDWLTSSAGQALIGAFRVDGQQLFTPNARQ